LFMAERVVSGMMKDQKGQSMTEFALLLPLLLLLICGIVDMGRLLFAYQSLHMTVQEAVRLGGLGKSDAEIVTYAKGHVQVANATELMVTIVPAQAARKPGQDVTVTLSYKLPFITPLVSQIIPVPTLSTNSTIRVE
jgi:Flp pilus assembly protein TadG